MVKRIIVRKDLKEFFPQEFSNRELIGKFIDYVMNHFFQTSSEEYINGYVGKKSVALEKGDFYITEPSTERQVYQLTPALTSIDKITGENKLNVEYCNFINTLKLQGCDINDQNRLLSNKCWSWCPPINVDMFVNYNFYYWLEEGPDAYTIDKKTNAVMDIIGKENYSVTIIENEKEKTIDFTDGMKVIFINDENNEYNNKPFIISGVGKSIQLLDDSHILEFSNSEADYFVMERGAVDGNAWSMRNRWFHRSVVSNIKLKSNTKLIQAKKPIICFNKDIQLYNHGTYNRGYVDLMIDDKKSSIHGFSPQPIQGVELEDGMIVVITKDENRENNNKLYQVTGISNIGTVILQPMANGLATDGKPMEGEGITVRKGKYAGNYYYFKENEWKLGQQKEKINQSPLFNLYDEYKEKLDSPIYYPQSNFEGNTLFDYVTSDDKTAIIDVDLNKPIVTKEYGNYIFDCTLDSAIYSYKNNDSIVEYKGFKFFKLNGSDTYLNNWYLSKNITSQYITTEITVTDDRKIEEIKDEAGFITKYSVYKLAYQPDVQSNRKNTFVYLNGTLLNSMNYYIKNKQLHINENAVTLVNEDNLYIKLLVSKIDGVIADGYYFDLPLSMTANATNGNIKQIKYNECFDQLKSIMENQTAFEGKSNGMNNYNNTKKDLSLGTEILQHDNPILKTMLLNAQQYTNIRSVMEYVSKEFNNFKIRYKNVIESMSVNGEFNENDDLMKVVVNALNKINIGKKGLNSFYNNGVASSLGECYIPATPAYLGIDNCYEPQLVELPNKTMVLQGHDGAFISLFNDYRDSALIMLEQIIYESIPSKWKDALPVYNKYKNIPGKFRKTSYSLEEFNTIKSSFLEKWANDNNLDYTKHEIFDESDPFTWNYSTCFDNDGNKLQGSYKAIYMYYYDTFRPHTNPWEMLGFGSKPSWWEERYGKAPYTSSNIAMWKDIENGNIIDGASAGHYVEFERKGLIEKYLPVDENGNLKNPLEIGIVSKAPIAYYAQQEWTVGDYGEYETTWMFTSTYRYNLQTIMYLLRPIEWVENNWDTLDRMVLFKDTDYEQTIIESSVNRPTPSEIICHNELVDGKYVKKIGIQQWISDFLVHENINITDYEGKMIRDIDMKLMYRCGRFYKKDSLKIISDNYGVIPSQNYHMDLYKTQTNIQATYSAIMIVKVENGYMIDGYDLSKPYFNVLNPVLTGKKTPIEIEGRNVIYYNQWKKEGKDAIRQVKYKTVFSSVQELFNIICGYGKYLEEKENWVFNTVLDDGRNQDMITFNQKAEDFIRWTVAQPEEGMLIVLNPGFQGMVIKHDAFLDVVGQYINGYWTMLNINKMPIYNDNISVYRHNGYSEITSNDTIALIKVNIIEYEHSILFDNKTLYGDTLYDPMLCIKAQRLKIIGTGVNGWNGTLFAPGYIISDDGAYPNFDKLADDFKYFFDTDDIRSQGIFGDYAKKTIGFQKMPNMERMLIDDRNIFDFYKGALREKGTRRSFNKLNRSNFIMNKNDSSINLFENWAFKLGKFGYTSDNYLMEFKINADKINQDPQIISFTTESNAQEKNSIVTIDWNNPNWLKKLSLKKENTFEFSDNTVFYPVGGFAQPKDVNYLVADIDEFNNVKDDIKLNETIWVVKKSNRDWDIYKKIPEGFMSMRVDNINELKKFNKNNLVKGDLIYVSKDILNNNLDFIKDPDKLMYKGEYIIDKPAGSVFKYNGTDYELYRIQNKVPDLRKINECFMIDNDSNQTMAKINLYDPMQGILPKKILDELNYITSYDPVSDYNDFYKWGDDKLGYLWWDLSKVRYLDYHQGDIYYRRNNWGKQLPGSEIAIMEWSVSKEKPKFTDRYVVRKVYNEQTATYVTYYYFWKKNVPVIPPYNFRHMSALTVSKTINSPQEQGIVWLAPIYIGTGDYAYSTFIIGNYDKVCAGSDFVVQFNFRTAEDLNEHVEWVLVREGDDCRIPEELWNKMKASIIGYDSLGQVVPEPSLDENNKIGISIRPRQTMFKNMQQARRNFVDTINNIFETRDVMTSTDVGSYEFNKVFLDNDQYPESDYEPFNSYYEMYNIKDTRLIGKTLLVLNDENHDGIWTLWKMNDIYKFELLDYQKYNVQLFWKYKDLYRDADAELAQPLMTFDTEIEFNDYFYNNKNIEKGTVFKVYLKNGKWELCEFNGMKGNSPVISKIGIEDGTIELNSRCYEFLSDEELINNTNEFIDGKTKYEYLTNESNIVLKKIFSYFEK